MKRVRRLLAAAASLAALCALGAQPAAAHTPTSRTAPQGHGDCTETGPDLRRGGVAWTCIKTVPATTSALTAVPAAAPRVASANPGADLCVKDDPNSIPSNRKAYCTRYLAEYVTLGEDSKVNGQAHVLVLAAAAMNSLPNAQWKEDIVIQVADMTPNISAVTMALSATCSGQCTAGAPAWGGTPVLLRKGQGRDDGTLSYSSSVGKGFDTIVQPSYHVNGTIITAKGGGRPVNRFVDWSGPKVRCDDNVSPKDGSPPGCIVDGHTANVTFHRSLYKGAAVAYEWAQKNLTGHFGAPGHLLNRWYVDPLDPEADGRRALTCDRGPFKFPRGATGIPNDSCDEYPFAKSTQGGNEGEQCIDITPREVGGVWDVANVTVDRGTPPNAPCIRAHVDGEDNSAAGREYARAVTSDRIMQGEAFEVIIDA